MAVKTSLWVGRIVASARYLLAETQRGIGHFGVQPLLLGAANTTLAEIHELSEFLTKIRR